MYRGGLSELKRIASVTLLSPWLMGLACALASSSTLAGTEREQFEYVVTYTGSISSNKPLDISRVVWVSPRPVASGASEVSVRISSEQFMKLELMFPFRYCYRAVYNRDAQRSQGFENFQRARKQLEYVSANFDWKKRILSSSSAKAELPGVSLNPFEGFQASAGQAAPSWKVKSQKSFLLPDILLDRVSMVQHLRTMNLKSGRVVSLPVSDGARMLEYWVDISDDEVNLLGKKWKAYRLRFETFDPVKDRPPPPPVDIWFSRDAERIPLRMASTYSFGDFDIRLTRIGKTGIQNIQCKNWQGFQ